MDNVVCRGRDVVVVVFAAVGLTSWSSPVVGRNGPGSGGGGLSAGLRVDLGSSGDGVERGLARKTWSKGIRDVDIDG